MESAARARIEILKQDVVGDIGHLLWILMGSIGIVLLIACANVANLLLVRAGGHHQELAARAALGASRTRLAGELLFEGIVVGMLGAAMGLLLAFALLRLLVVLAPPGLPRVHEIGINLSVLLFTVFVALFASLLSCHSNLGQLHSSAPRRQNRSHAGVAMRVENTQLQYQLWPAIVVVRSS